MEDCIMNPILFLGHAGNSRVSAICSELLEKSGGEELAESGNHSPEFSDPKPSLLPSN